MKRIATWPGKDPRVPTSSVTSTIVKDDAAPENEGKVFLYRYGKKIHEKLLGLMNPEFDDEQPIDPVNFWDGANFRLRIRRVSGFFNYDKSVFDSSTSLLDGDYDKLEEIYNRIYPLGPFVDEGNSEMYKTYSQFKKKLGLVLNIPLAEDDRKVQTHVLDIDNSRSAAEEPKHEEILFSPDPDPENDKAGKVTITDPKATEDLEDTLKYFQQLADE